MTEEQKITAYMVAIQQIVFAVANRFTLPIEFGYDVIYERFMSGPRHMMTVQVMAPEWGKKSLLQFVLIWNEDTHIWGVAPPEEEMYLALEDFYRLPMVLRNRRFQLSIMRRSPNPTRRWAEGPYPRYQVIAEVVQPF